MLQPGQEVKRKWKRDMRDTIVTVIYVICFATRSRYQVDICPWVRRFDEDTTDVRLLFEI